MKFSKVEVGKHSRTPCLTKTVIELDVIVPTKSLKKIGEHGLREVTVKQDTNFGFEGHFNKGRIDKSKIDINFGFGKLTVKTEDLKKAVVKAKDRLVEIL